MDAIGIKVVLKIGKWPDHLKNARAGKRCRNRRAIIVTAVILRLRDSLLRKRP